MEILYTYLIFYLSVLTALPWKRPVAQRRKDEASIVYAIASKCTHTLTSTTTTSSSTTSSTSTSTTSSTSTSTCYSVLVVVLLVVVLVIPRVLLPLP